jgi:hypothetical protein
VGHMVAVRARPGNRWSPLGLEYAPIPWRVRKQAGRMRLNLGDLRTDPLSFARLPKLDVAGSSPVARSLLTRCLRVTCAARFRPTDRVVLRWVRHWVRGGTLSGARALLEGLQRGAHFGGRVAPHALARSGSCAGGDGAAATVPLVRPGHGCRQRRARPRSWLLGPACPDRRHQPSRRWCR